MRNREDVRITTCVSRSSDQSPVLVYAVPTKREYALVEGLRRDV